MLCTGADCRLGNRWVDLCSRLPRSPPAASLRRSSACASGQHQHPSGCHPRESSTTDGYDVQALAEDGTTAEKSPASGTASSHVLPALRHLLMKPVVGADWIPPTMSVHGALIKQSSSLAERGDSADSPPTLKPEPLSTAPNIKQEFVAVSQHNDFDVRDRLTTTSGFWSRPEVHHESRPPRKRRPEVCTYVRSSYNTSGCNSGKPTTNAGSCGEYPVQNGILSEPEVERCPSDLSSVPPDITVDRSPNPEITQRNNEGIVTDRRADHCFAHAPRKRFRYEFLSYVDDGAVANSLITSAAAKDAAVGHTRDRNNVINLTTSTRVSPDHPRTRDVAVQCAMTTGDDVGDVNPEAPGYGDPRRPVHHLLPCSTSTDNLTSFCWYCGIVFDDDVLHAIHMGCHSVADKFVCNVCGLACGDRYGFNSHLVRGHIQATAVSEQPAPGSVLPLQLPSTARLVPQTTSLPASSLSTTSADSHRWTAYERC